MSKYPKTKLASDKNHGLAPQGMPYSGLGTSPHIRAQKRATVINSDIHGLLINLRNSFPGLSADQIAANKMQSADFMRKLSAIYNEQARQPKHQNQIAADQRKKAKKLANKPKHLANNNLKLCA